MIYLDNAATTFPKPECVYERMDAYGRSSVVNAGRGAYRAAREANAMLRRRIGIRILELPLAEDLSLDLEATARMFAENPPDFVSVSAVSNVTGYVLPAGEIFRMAKEYGAFTLLDAAQGMGLIKIRFAQTHADAIAFAGHKTLYASFGIAGFLIRGSC